MNPNIFYYVGLNEYCSEEGFCRLRPDWDGRPTTHPTYPLPGDIFEPKPRPDQCEFPAMSKHKYSIRVTYFCCGNWTC